MSPPGDGGPIPLRVDHLGEPGFFSAVEQVVDHHCGTGSGEGAH